jgi:hypothetical protein
LFAAVNAGRPGVALSLLRYLGRFGHDESRRGPLRIDGTLPGWRARERVNGAMTIRCGRW